MLFSQLQPPHRSLLLVRPRPAFAAVVSLLTVSAAWAHDWGQYQHDAAHTGRSQAVVNPLDLTLAWTAPTVPTFPGSFQKLGYSNPVIVGDTVFGTLKSFDTNIPTTISAFFLVNGVAKWTYSGNFIESPAAVAGGFVVFVGRTSDDDGALYVLDSASGALRYVVPISAYLGLIPTLIQDPTTGNVTAIITNGGEVSAVSLGLTSGTVLWEGVAFSGGASIPTVVGSSIVVAGPGEYYALDLATGAVNQFHQGDIFGGGGVTVAYDAVRSEFYVREFHDSSHTGATLSAYRYMDNDHITLLWQRAGAGIGNGSDGGTVAVGPNGEVYSAGSDVILELDPATGATLRSIPGSFAAGMTPALTNGVLWAYSGFSTPQTLAYDLSTLQLIRSFPGARGDTNIPYSSPGAFAAGYFVLDYGYSHGRSFDVYVAPTPTLTPTPAPTPAPTPSGKTITLRAAPVAGGTVVGTGIYQAGQRITVRAVGARGYKFKQWTQNGRKLSNSPSYSFTVTSNRILTAQFTKTRRR